MRDFRFDALHDHWVCIAEARGERPVEFESHSQRKASLVCPFCPGQESGTPREAAAVRRDGEWQARAFSNKYPAFGEAADARPVSSSSDADSSSLTGRQEVLVIARRHIQSLAELVPDEIGPCFDLCADRMASFRSEKMSVHTSLFMNCRAMAGASIEHAHFQLIGAPLVTPWVTQRTERIREGVLAEQVQDEERDGDRIIESSDDWISYAPFASRFAGQTRLLPRQSAIVLGENDADWQELGRQLVRLVGRMEKALANPAYNVVFCFPPDEAWELGWFVDIIPRFPQIAGFELATDFYVNPLSPETTARLMRQT